MASNSDPISSVKATLKKYQAKETADGSEETFESAFYLFLSLDLVNSTEFKTKSDSWPSALDLFNQVARNEVGKITDIRFWKFVGDEVLFFKKIKSIQDLEESLDKTLLAVTTVTDQIQNLSIDSEFAKFAPILSVKGTAWICKATTVLSKTKREELGPEHRNLAISLPGYQNVVLPDFLGPDIDTGFRISKFAHSNLITISAELARVLVKKGNKKIKAQLRIVGFEQLKGVWNNRSYPIIWFSDKWKRHDELFQYDEKFNSQLVKTAIDRYRETIKLRELEKIFGDVQLLEISNELLKIPNRNSPNELFVDGNPEATLELEVHCVAICFNPEGKALVAKRLSNKKIMPDKWEFGCAKLSPKKTFFDSMKNEYKADFGVDITFSCNDPIATYYVEETGVPGVIFIANVLKQKQIDKSKWQCKHQEIKWVDPSNLGSKLNDENCVPNFRITLEKAHAVWAAATRN